jgi:hypothetical protein
MRFGLYNVARMINLVLSLLIGKLYFTLFSEATWDIFLSVFDNIEAQEISRPN